MIKPNNEEGSNAPNKTGSRPATGTGQTSTGDAQGAASSGRILAPDEECVVSHARAGKSVNQIEVACRLSRGRVVEILNEQKLPVIVEPTEAPVIASAKEPEIVQPPHELSESERCIITQGKKGHTVPEIMRKCRTSADKTRKVLRENKIGVKNDPEIRW